MIVAAVGTSSGGKPELAKRIQEAMHQAVVKAFAQGVSIDNSEEILRRKAAARQAVLESEGEWR